MKDMDARIPTQRLLLRPLTVADCTARYVGWLNDPAVNRLLETRHSEQTLESVTRFVEAVNASEREHLFGIFLADGVTHIGNIKVGPIARNHPLADVSLLIGDTASWGRGYAAEAIAGVSRHAFASLGLRKLSASMYDVNVASYRAFRRAGYRDEGRRRAHYMLDGRMTDVLLLGLIPEDLAS